MRQIKKVILIAFLILGAATVKVFAIGDKDVFILRGGMLTETITWRNDESLACVEIKDNEQSYNQYFGLAEEQDGFLVQELDLQKSNVVVGIGKSLLYSRDKQRVQTLVYNTDGVMTDKIEYKDNRIAAHYYDFDKDGVFDEIMYFDDQGVPTRGEIDNDNDGNIDETIDFASEHKSK